VFAAYEGLSVDRDLWPNLLPSSTSTSPTRSRGDWTLTLGPQPPTPLPPTTPRRVRGVRTTTDIAASGHEDSVSSESADDTGNLQWVSAGPSQRGPPMRTASAPMLKRPRGKGSDATFGGMRSETPSADSYATPASPTSSSAHSPRARGRSQLGLNELLAAPSRQSSRHASPTYSQADWQYRVRLGQSSAHVN
jgi:hypothetical protein